MNSLQSTVRAHTTMAPTPHSNRRREHFSIQFGENTHTSYIFCALQLSQFFFVFPFLHYHFCYAEEPKYKEMEYLNADQLPPCLWLSLRFSVQRRKVRT
jgi:hypothetical protein